MHRVPHFAINESLVAGISIVDAASVTHGAPARQHFASDRKGVLHLDSLSLLAVTAAAFLLAGFVKGVIGGGLPTVSIGLLGIVMPVPQAAALVVAPAFLSNVWQSLGPQLWPLTRRLWPMLVGICVGAWLGAGIMTGMHSQWARTGLGAALAIYALIGLVKMRLHVPPAYEPWLGPIVGVATGAIASATGVFVIPCGPYLQAIGLGKDDMVQSLGITFAVSTVALAGIVAHANALQFAMSAPAVLALLAAVVGLVLGQRVRARLPEETFRTAFFAGLLLLGGYLVSRGIL
jgi:uncharacterized membrane protein YfcA